MTMLILIIIAKLLQEVVHGLLHRQLIHANTVYGLTGGTQSITGTRISKAQITASEAEYDTTDAAASDITLSGLVGSETLTLSGTGSIASANVFDGPNFPITQGTIAITDGTGLASNYNLNMGNLTITAKPVDVLSRSYDATTDADSSILSIGGLVGSKP